MIEGIRIKPLVKHIDDRGYLMEILRDDDKEFTRFGQIYISMCLPGIVKAWHAHTLQTDHICAVRGLAKIGIFDGRENSPTYRQSQAIIIGEIENALIEISPGIWHGYMCLGMEPAYIMNIPTMHYNREEPDELRVDPFNNDFNFDWLPKSR